MIQADDRAQGLTTAGQHGSARSGSGTAHQLVQTLGANLALALLGFITGPLVARLLGPGGRGELAAIQTLPSFIASLAMLGLPDAVVYFSAREPGQAGTFWLSGTTLSLLAAPVFFGVGYAIMPLALAAQSPSTIAAGRVYLLLIPVFALSGMALQTLRGRRDLLAWNLFRIAPGLCWLALLLFVATGHGRSAPGWLATHYLVIQGLLIVPVVLLVMRRIRGPFRPQASVFRPMLRFGLPSVGGSVPQALNQRLDQMLMAALLGPHALGLYAVAVTWSSAMSPALSAFGMVAFPHVAAQTSDESKAHSALLTTRLASLAAACLTVVLYAVTPLFLPLIFGADFGESVMSARILVVAAGFLGLSLVLEDTLRGLGQPTAVLKSEAIGLVFTVALLAVLLGPLGIVGAAIASLCGYSATAAVLIHYVKGRLGCSHRSVVLPTSAEVDLLRRYASAALGRAS